MSEKEQKMSKKEQKVSKNEQKEQKLAKDEQKEQKEQKRANMGNEHLGVFLNDDVIERKNLIMLLQVHKPRVLE